MMRYQRVSPDYNPLSSSSSNGAKSSFRCKEDGGENGTKTILTNGAGFRFRSPSKPPPSQENNNISNQYHNSNNNNSAASASASSSPLSDNNTSSGGRGGGGGDVLMQLQWGHKKRARLSRSEIRSLTDDSSSSSSIHRRGGRRSPFVDKPPTLLHSHSLPPPNASLIRAKDCSGFVTRRRIEDRPGTGNGSPLRSVAGGGGSRSTEVKGSLHPSVKIDKKIRKEERASAGSGVVSCTTTTTATPVKSEQNAAAAATTTNKPAAAAATTTKPAAAAVISMVNNVEMEVMEWPKIHVSLSRKEKEDDFLAMKGTKLPHRPKKRAKNIDRALQYCFPGMWLSDLTKSRYEVREKKVVKKQKRRGLKGMESDSE